MDLPEVIHIDHSIFSTYQTCREKCRLSYVEGYRPVITAPPLDFGSAWHAGLAALYSNNMSIEAARGAFIHELQIRESALPLSMDSDEKRSIERGLYMLEAYVERWRNEPYEVVRRPDTDEPYVEIGFAVYITSWRGIPVMLIGRIDRIMKSKVTGKIVNVESKTTSQGLDTFMKQLKPNHQVTGYHLAAKRLGLDISGTLWDAVFVSSRQPNPKKGGWMTYGIDFEKDFGRVETRRSDTDIEEFLSDLINIVNEYCEWRYGAGAKSPRWPRNAPTACHMYGGCQFRDVCASNVNTDILHSNFRIEPWEPWALAGGDEKVVKA